MLIFYKTKVKTMHYKLKNFIKSWVPELILIFKQGYSGKDFFSDVKAGFLCSVVAFPLFMTFAIAAGASPSIGIMTCIVAGIMSSILGGARFQIIGPTGAFAVIVLNIIKDYGYDGLLCALLMAGFIMIFFGFAGLGNLIRYLPYPITAGFTAGIGLSIIITQLGNFLSIKLQNIPSNVFEKLLYYWNNLETMNIYSFTLGLGSLIFITFMQKHKPKIPRYFLVLITGVVASILFEDKGMETIGSRFGEISLMFQTPTISKDFFSIEKIQILFGSAFSLAFLGSVESLMGAVISDNLSGFSHRSNTELVAQGAANICSALFGGLPATCSLSTTALNVKVGAVSSISALVNIMFLALFMICLGKFVNIIPMSCLAAMLLSTAWNMAALKENKYIFLAPKSDSFVFIVTTLITLLVNIVVAVETGIVLAAFLFIRRAVETTQAETFAKIISKGECHGSECECVKIHGYLFFGAAPAVQNVLKNLPKQHKHIYIDMQDVPFIDVTGAKVLQDFVAEVKKRNINVVVGGLNKRTLKVLKKMGHNKDIYGHLYSMSLDT